MTNRLKRLRDPGKLIVDIATGQVGESEGLETEKVLRIPARKAISARPSFLTPEELSQITPRGNIGSLACMA
jgi:hypothetical protein